MRRLAKQAPRLFIHSAFKRASSLNSTLSILNESQVNANDFRLYEADYPSYFQDMLHPDDLKTIKNPTCPQFIRHHKSGHHRLLFRICFQLADSNFVPMTFLCNTGLPSHFYFSPEAFQVLEEGGRILEDELESYVLIENEKIAAKKSPISQNIMGLLMLERLGLNLSVNKYSFSDSPEFF
jgi:hypothetical protein